jgi:hypothetical protein
LLEDEKKTTDVNTQKFVAGADFLSKHFLLEQKRLRELKNNEKKAELIDRAIEYSVNSKIYNCLKACYQIMDINKKDPKKAKECVDAFLETIYKNITGKSVEKNASLVRDTMNAFKSFIKKEKGSNKEEEKGLSELEEDLSSLEKIGRGKINKKTQQKYRSNVEKYRKKQEETLKEKSKIDL